MLVIGDTSAFDWFKLLIIPYLALLGISLREAFLIEKDLQKLAKEMKTPVKCHYSFIEIVLRTFIYPYPVYFSESVQVEKDVIFKSFREGQQSGLVQQNNSLKMDIYIPPSNSLKKRIPILWIHGGGWVFGAKDCGVSIPFILQIAEKHNSVVFNIDYRLCPRASVSASIEDCYTACEFIREHAAQYRVDLERLYVGGESAGAHLACVLAFKYPELAIQGVIDVFGVHDFENSKAHAPRYFHF